VKNMIVTHGLTNVPGLSHGAGEEGVGNGARDRDLLPAVPGRPERAAGVPQALDADRRQAGRAGDQGLGARDLVVSTDLGQSANMVHPDGVEAAIGAMKREGISMPTSTP
jgi:hypothetical protein